MPIPLLCRAMPPPVRRAMYPAASFDPAVMALPNPAPAFSSPIKP